MQWKACSSKHQSSKFNLIFGSFFCSQSKQNFPNKQNKFIHCEISVLIWINFQTFQYCVDAPFNKLCICVSRNRKTFIWQVQSSKNTKLCTIKFKGYCVFCVGVYIHFCSFKLAPLFIKLITHKFPKQIFHLQDVNLCIIHTGN